MKAAGLKDIATVVDSTAVLIKSKSPSNQKLVDLIASRIRGVIGLRTPLPTIYHNLDSLTFISDAQKYVLCQYNIARSRLQDGVRVTPGKRAPTITTLEEPDWVAVSSMVLKKDVAKVMDELTEVKATDILVLGLINTRTD